MMKFTLHIGCLLFLALSGCHFVKSPEAVIVTGGLHFQDEDAIPPSVLTDVEAMRAQIDPLTGSSNLWWIEMSNSTVSWILNYEAYWDTYDTDNIWIWPDWRESDRMIIFEQGHSAYFASDRYVVIKTRDGRSELLDLKDNSITEIPDRSLTVLRISSNDRDWACIDSAGDVFVGRDIETLESIVLSEELKVASSGLSLDWIGRSLVILSQDTGASIYRLQANSVVDTAEDSVGIVRINDESFFSQSRIGIWSHLVLDESGVINRHTAWSIDELCRPETPSPSGLFVIAELPITTCFPI